MIHGPGGVPHEGRLQPVLHCRLVERDETCNASSTNPDVDPHSREITCHLNHTDLQNSNPEAKTLSMSTCETYQLIHVPVHHL